MILFFSKKINEIKKSLMKRQATLFMRINMNKIKINLIDSLRK
jgi:hypothetical protein